MIFRRRGVNALVNIHLGNGLNQMGMERSKMDEDRFRKLKRPRYPLLDFIKDALRWADK